MAKLLIVDDQEQNRYMLDILLKGNGHEVISATNGEEALDKARQGPPDLIITDILMPVMDGFTLCREWKKDQVLKAVPLVFYTATYTDPKDEKLALSLGAERFIIKPTAPDKFISIISEILEEHQSGRMQAASPPLEDEEVYLKEYNQALVHKLEDKLQQLEDTNQALQASEEKYRTLMEAVADPVIVYDLEGRVVYANRAFSRVFGWRGEELIGKKLDFVPSEDTSQTLDKIKQALEGQSLSNHETHRLTKDGSLIDVSISAAHYKDTKGEIAGIVVSLQDITSRKLAESEKAKLEAQLRQAQKMEAIGTLAGGIAHDFNNILGVIIGFADLSMLAAQDNPSLTGNLQKVLDAGIRAKDLVKQILTFSRQTEQEFKPTRLSLVAKELVEMLQATIPPSITMNKEVINDCVVMADSTQLHQVLMNISTNAVQAMQETGGVLSLTLDMIELDEDSVHLVPDIKPGVYQKISISDTGTGIPQERLDRIFDPFFTTKKKGEGTGLGLSVAHGIVKNHGGKITVYSEPGKGTTFTIYLPALTEKESTTSISEVKRTLPTGNEHILYVDDEELLVEVGASILGKLGYRVTSFISSLKALENFRQNPHDYDLVVTDLNMPMMTGIDLAGELIRLRRDIPIILCTGFSDKVSSTLSQSIGIKKTIMKPIVARDIAIAIREALDL
jgi:PAS domain S-box-containing protein